MEEFIIIKINGRLMTGRQIVITYDTSDQMDTMSSKLGNKLGLRSLIRTSRNNYGADSLGSGQGQLYRSNR